MPTHRSPIGTHDLMPPDSARWRALCDLFAATAQRYGFGLVSTPIFEDVGVFRQVGGGTDVVGKEMYEFADRSDRAMALRPEGTAAICRAFAQHRPTKPFKAWYQGPYFRYEAPQAGRYRQFHQLGAETLGTDDPNADVEIIALAAETIAATGLTQVRLVLNTLGDTDTRPRYVAALGQYLSERLDELDEADRAKAAEYPLRLLDSKHAATAAVIAEAPRIEEYLSNAAASHFERVKSGLDDLGLAYSVEPRLVRGLDYYTHTTFEFCSDALETAQDTVCGGGRYNGLVEALGGPDTPGIGFAMGLERLLLACDAEGCFAAPPPSVEVWVIDLTGGKAALRTTHQLRQAGIAADRSFDGRSMRAQIRSADRAGAKAAIIVGKDELESGQWTLRWLRPPFPPPFSEDERELKVPQAELTEALSAKLGSLQNTDH